MASVTLTESAKLALDDLVAGVIESIVTINQSFQVMPFDGIDGNSLKYNRENALGDVEALGVGGTITAKAAATFTSVNSALTTIVGDAEVNGLIQATRSSDGNDQKAVQVASKAKAAGREYQRQFINGTGASDEFDGLLNLCVSGQTVDTGVNGGPLTFDFLDEMQDLVTAKDGQVDFYMVPFRTRRAYRKLLRAQPGAGIVETMELPDGSKVITYNGVPFFVNDYIPVDQTKGSGSAQTTIFAGNWDDGSRTNGVAGLTAMNAAGIQIKEIGELETRDESLTRVVWYTSLALFSELALSCADGITD